MITIVDYGMGNLRSVQKGFERVGAEATIATSPHEIASAERLVLPGVGAFRDAIGELRRKDLVSPVLDHIASGKPFLGICLGLQLLFDESDEGGRYAGLGVLRGRVERFPEVPGYKVPHMGWNRLDRSGNCPVFSDIPPTHTSTLCTVTMSCRKTNRPWQHARITSSHSSPPWPATTCSPCSFTRKRASDTG